MDVIECGMIRRSAVSHTALPHQIEEIAISSRLGLAVCDISDDCGVSNNNNNNNNMKFLRPAAHSIDDDDSLNSSVSRLKFSGVKSSEQQQGRSSSCCQHSTQYFCNWIINCGQCLCGVLATPFYRFLARFSGKQTIHSYF